MYAGADNDEESSDEDGDTRLSPVSMGKKVSKTSSKTPKTSTKKPKRGANTPWLNTMKANIPDFIPLEDDQYVKVACEARPLSISHSGNNIIKRLLAHIIEQIISESMIGWLHQGVGCCRRTMS